MPYLEMDRKIAARYTATNSGELNYRITSVLRAYIEDNGLSYQTINDIVGALEGAKLEFYRRVAVPYENYKIKVNGDVYGDEAKERCHCGNIKQE